MKTRPANALCAAKYFALPRQAFLRPVVSTLESLFLLATLPLIVCPRVPRGETAFAAHGGGGRSGVVRWALAALICGFFWEMSNYGNLAKRIYLVPYVDRFRLFEMPLLGYAGYLPFGLECPAFARMFLGYDTSGDSATTQEGGVR